MKIVLLGMKGVGKTTLGVRLSSLLELPFIDTDRVIEMREGRGVVKIYEEEGGCRFRQLEHGVLKEVESMSAGVVALGGGGYLSVENQNILRRMGTLICLHMEKEELLKRWLCWPAVCQSRTHFDIYYEERVQKLKELPCIWIDARREDLLEAVAGVCCG